MADFKTPGVYIQEISTLPASVAPVATAIPAFVGYTELQPTDKPVRITSLLEYRELFGGPVSEAYDVVLTGPDTVLENTTIQIVEHFPLSPYVVYYQLEMYFMNGGGPCYIVSVKTYEPPGSITFVDRAELEAGIDILEEEDEPTILVVPEAITMGTSDRQTINNKLLTQCNKLQDRFAIMDVAVDTAKTVNDDAIAFRGEVGTSYLKYGAAYYPNLKTNLIRHYSEASVIIEDNRGGQGPFDNCPLDALAIGGNYATGKISITDFNVIDADTFTIGSDTYKEGQEFTKASGNATTAQALLDAINNAAPSDYTASRSGNVITITATTEGIAGEIALTYTDDGLGTAATVTGTEKLKLLDADTSLYNEIIKKLNTYKLDLYPSASMAGIYARIDRDRGVWKAPANVSVNGVVEPGILVTAEEQENLNVDAGSGKSINAIRPFAGKGILVWGARTLAGNDNEWRYIPVRRLFIFMEESIQKATEPSVFEPNVAQTWSKLKAMIENFLTVLWNDGALAGATPEEAFFVNIGLGKTMTAQDILEGRLIIEVGVAAVRPAEFIILKFSHKLQES